jgi:hypothetical protein
MISHPFYCLREDYTASYELQKVQYITTFLLLAGICRGLLGSREGSRDHIISFARGNMPWPPRKYRRCMMSHPSIALREDDVASYELQKVQYITFFLLLAVR